MLHAQDDSFVKFFEKKYHRPGEFLIIQDQKKSNEDLEKFFSQIKNNHLLDQCAVLKIDNPFLPFLKNKDNVLIEVSTSEQKNNPLSNLLLLFDLPSNILEDFPSTLSLIDCLKLQMIHEILLSKEILFLPDISEICTTNQLQSLLRIFMTVAKQQQITILMLTDNQKILSSSYPLI